MMDAGKTEYGIAPGPKRPAIVESDAKASELSTFQHEKDTYPWQAQAKLDMTWSRPKTLAIVELTAEGSELLKFQRTKNMCPPRVQVRLDMT